MRSGVGIGSGFSSTAFTTVKMAVLAPMPSASAETAAMREAGALAEQVQRVLDVIPEIAHWTAPLLSSRELDCDGWLEQ